MKKISFSVIICILIMSCNTQVLPKKLSITKQQSFYVGLYDFTVYDITNTNLDYKIESFNGYPVYDDLFDDHYIVQDWEQLSLKSDIYKTFINSIEPVKNMTTSKNPTWIEEFIANLRSNHNDFFIAGVYKEISSNNHYYNYYLIDTKKNSFYVVKDTD